MPKPQTYPDSPTLAAVRAVGGPTAAARICGAGLASVQRWLRAGHVPGLREGLALAKAAGVDPASLSSQTQ